MSGSPTQAAADEVKRDIELAAELEGLSVEEVTRKGATIYARQLLARRDALPLLRPAPWRHFRLEDGGKEVSFRVRIPTDVFRQAIFIERNVRQYNGGCCSDDACKIAEEFMIVRLENIPIDNKAERLARRVAYLEWLKSNKDLEKRLAEIEMEVEHA